MSSLASRAEDARRVGRPVDVGDGEMLVDRVGVLVGDGLEIGDRLRVIFDSAMAFFRIDGFEVRPFTPSFSTSFFRPPPTRTAWLKMVRPSRRVRRSR
jgi:hypothetical protein